MSKERNNVAILGTGHIAAKMAATLQQMKDVNCYAVASREQIRAKASAREWGFKQASGSYEELASAPQVDLVYMPPPPSHP